MHAVCPKDKTPANNCKIVQEMEKEGYILNMFVVDLIEDSFIRHKK